MSKNPREFQDEDEDFDDDIFGPDSDE